MLSKNAEQHRYPELDSLRGLAALVVVFYHFVLMWPALLDSLNPIEWHGIHLTLLLHPLYTGHESVMLFFVLSGLVLSLPYIRGRSQPYPIFLTRRILRIYGPYLGALALSIAGAAIWHGNHGHRILAWSERVHPKLVLEHIAFLGVYDWNQFNFVIWSLIDEMRISIIFPVLAFLVLRVRTTTALLLAVAASFVAMIAVRNQPQFSDTSNIMMTVHYVAFFILGILLAMHLKKVSERFRSFSVAVQVGIFFAAFLLYNFTGPLALLHESRPLFMAADWLVAVGAVGYIVVGLCAPVAQRLLISTVPRFLGKISYSLYLIHAPILLAVTFFIRNRISMWEQLPIYLFLSIGCAYLFFLGVEQPFVRAGQRLGKIAPSPVTSAASNHLEAI
jgi:peptidoglycan/LPS O-acetylase OafA/YrhL